MLIVALPLFSGRVIVPLAITPTFRSLGAGADLPVRGTRFRTKIRAQNRPARCDFTDRLGLGLGLGLEIELGLGLGLDVSSRTAVGMTVGTKVRITIWVRLCGLWVGLLVHA